MSGISQFHSSMTTQPKRNSSPTPRITKPITAKTFWTMLRSSHHPSKRSGCTGSPVPVPTACSWSDMVLLLLLDPVSQCPGQVLQGIALARGQRVDALAGGLGDLAERQAAEHLGLHHPSLRGRQG